MRFFLKILGAIIAVLGIILIFTSGDVFSIILELIGGMFFALEFWIGKNSEKKWEEAECPDKFPRNRHRFDSFRNNGV